MLGRYQDERIMIGDDIEIVVVRAGGMVKLGISAPRGVPIHRKEVYEAIQRARRDVAPDGDSG